MEINFSGSYEKKLFHQSIFLVNKPSTRSAVLRILGFLAVVAIYIGLTINVLKSETQSASEITGLLRHLITLTVFFSFAFQPYIKAFTTSRNLWNDPITRMPIQGRISTQGIFFGSSHTLSWDTFIKFEKIEALIVLQTINQQIVILPRSFFENDRDWKTLQQWIDRYVKAAI